MQSPWAKHSGFSGGGGGGDSMPPPPPRPTILLAKPPPRDGATARSAGMVDSGSGGSQPVVMIMRDEGRLEGRGKLGNLKFVNENLEFCGERLQQLLLENSDFTVVGVLGPPGVGKSTVMNELYGFDPSTSSGGLTAFPVQSDQTQAAARHCTSGIELRVSPDRLILLDTQPVFSSSLLVDIYRPDGSSSLTPVPGESFPAEVAHDILSLQLAVFLFSVCHVVLLVSEGLADTSMWRFLTTVDMLKHGIPDVSLLPPRDATSADGDRLAHQLDADSGRRGGAKAGDSAGGAPASASWHLADLADTDVAEHFADPVFIHTKLRGSELSEKRLSRATKLLTTHFISHMSAPLRESVSSPSPPSAQSTPPPSTPAVGNSAAPAANLQPAQEALPGKGGGGGDAGGG